MILDRRLCEVECTAYRLIAVTVHHKLQDRKSTRLNSSHLVISYAVFCLKKKHTRFLNQLPLTLFMLRVCIAAHANEVPADDDLALLTTYFHSCLYIPCRNNIQLFAPVCK